MCRTNKILWVFSFAENKILSYKQSLLHDNVTIFLIKFFLEDRICSKKNLMVKKSRTNFIIICPEVTLKFEEESNCLDFAQNYMDSNF